MEVIIVGIALAIVFPYLAAGFMFFVYASLALFAKIVGWDLSPKELTK